MKKKFYLIILFISNLSYSFASALTIDSNNFIPSSLDYSINQIESAFINQDIELLKQYVDTDELIYEVTDFVMDQENSFWYEWFDFIIHPILSEIVLFVLEQLFVDTDGILSIFQENSATPLEYSEILNQQYQKIIHEEKILIGYQIHKDVFPEASIDENLIEFEFNKENNIWILKRISNLENSTNLNENNPNIIDDIFNKLI